VGTPKVFEATMNRDAIIRGMRERASTLPEGTELPDFESDTNFGSPESVITAAVDVTEFLDHKRRAMQAHGSQISEQSFFLQMPPDVFGFAFGTEWYIRDGQGPGITETEVL
jgi:LmbE family N-acetylglucosaminyl deacetylase